MPEQSYSLIPLTRGQFAKVDCDDYVSLSAYKWSALWSKYSRSFYAVRACGGKSILMHRDLLGLAKGDSLRGDHINHDTLDNRRANLRRATVSQNAMNGRVRVTNTSGCPGVYWHPATSKWRVKVYLNRKCVCGGLFERFEDATERAKALRQELHGEFAYVP